MGRSEQSRVNGRGWEETSPTVILPESAVLLAHHLTQRIGVGEGDEKRAIFCVDADPIMASSILDAGCTLTAFQCHRTTQQLGELADRFDTELECMSGTLMEPLSDAHQEAYDAALIDGLYQQSGW